MRSQFGQRPVTNFCFTARLVTRDGSSSLVLRGQADISVSDRLAAILRQQELTSCPVTVDMGQLTFIDSHGFDPLLQSAHRRAVTRRPRIALARVSPIALRLLTVLDEIDRFDYVNDAERAS